MRIIDLTDQQFGRLTVLYKTDKRCGHNVVWHCKCSCGNEVDVDGGALRQGKTKSCGCLRKEKASELGKRTGGHTPIKDITNQKFGRLTALDFNPEQRKWKCKCDCGKEVYVRYGDLQSGNTSSCGCLRKEKTAALGKSCLKDLTGKQVGRLTVLELTDKKIGPQHVWKCQCTCGTITYVTSDNLSMNRTQSCGCLLSKGEEKISRILSEAKIFFEKQKSFDTCVFKTGKKAKFDFYVDNKYLIEFDGIQHFESGRGWNTEEKFQTLKQRDNFKNNWCKENNIPLIRIPYNHLDNLTLEDLVLDTSSFIKE